MEGRRGCVLCKNGLDKFGYRDVLYTAQTVSYMHEHLMDLSLVIDRQVGIVACLCGSQW